MSALQTRELVTSVPAASTDYTFNATYREVLSVQVTWTSSSSSFAYIVRTSNDGTNYVDLGASQAILNNSGGTHIQVKGVKDAKYVKVALTKTSGTLTAFSAVVAFQARS